MVRRVRFLDSGGFPKADPAFISPNTGNVEGLLHDKVRRNSSNSLSLSKRRLQTN